MITSDTEMTVRTVMQSVDNGIAYLSQISPDLLLFYGLNGKSGHQLLNEWQALIRRTEMSCYLMGKAMDCQQALIERGKA